MRIAALRLLAYGPFTNRSLEFGGHPGFHLVYGDNEAGKSTTLRALSSVLFGYPHEVIDNHRHDAKDILLGAELVAKNCKSLSFQRRRRGKNALADINGAALEESAVARLFGGASREIFESVFALDHRRLHEHAQALLSGRGSLGVALAAAGAGLADLKAALDRLKRERTELFLPGGSKPELNKRISRLQELRKETRQRLVSLPEYRKREKEIAIVEEDLAETRVRERQFEAELAKLGRIARILPLRARLAASRAQLDALAAVPTLPPDASERRIKAESERTGAEAAIAQADKALSELTEAAARIVVDQTVLQNAQAIESLSQRRGSVEDAERSLPRRDAEREQLYQNVGDLLAKAEIGGAATELGTLLPSLVKRRQVESLARKGREIATKKAAAADRTAKTTQALELTQERLKAAGELRDTRALGAALRAADELGDIRATIVDRTRVLADKKKMAQVEIAGLGLQPGDASLLRALAVPSDETVTRYRQRFTAVEAEEGKLAARTGQLNEQLVDIEKRITELAQGVGVATREQLQEVREQREAMWVVLRGIYVDRKSGLEERARALAGDVDLAGALELKTEAADRTADAIIAHSKEAAELSLSISRRDQVRQSLADAEAQSEAIRKKREALEEDWRSTWPAELAAVYPPAEMAGWLKRRETILREDRECQAEAVAISSLENKDQEATTRLAEALAPLTPVAPQASLPKLRVLARGIVDSAAAEATRHATALKALEIAQGEAKDSGATLARLQDESTAWSTTWQSALRNAGMDEGLAIDPATTIIEIMTQLDALKPQIDQLTHRIDAMSSESQAYRQEIDALGPLAADYNASSALEISRQLDERLRRARAAAAELRNLEGQQKLHEEANRKAQEQLDRSKRALEALCLAAGCEDAGQLAEVEQRARRKQQYEHERDDLEARILDQGSGLSLVDLLAECEGVDGDNLSAGITDRQTERTKLTATVEALMKQQAELRAAFDAMFGKSEAAESRQDAANVEAEITNLVQRYSDLALQEIVLRQAIDLYRERNQGPILGRAKDLFSQLTNGAYSGLRVDVDENSEPILIAEHTVRGSLEIEALSDGTVDPLYLALRLAAVQEHNATQEPLPFVADDLLLNLDNMRAQAALRVLGGMAEDNQVLFFTHHEHMVTLAETIVPANVLTVHRL
jgi:uncharacterized protein YhaN